jgi:dihydrofolate reductase
MKCSAFIAISADGYIATPDGGVEWLELTGNSETGDREQFGSGGFEAYIASVDCMIMGRKCMDTISSFNLTPEQWPYGDLHIIVLSKSVTQAPENLKERVEMYSGEIPALIDRLTAHGYEHAYIDGGATITSFINHKLIDEMTITQAPILLGDGLPLFGKIMESVRLSEAKAKTFSNDFIQWKYTVNYA